MTTEAPPSALYSHVETRLGRSLINFVVEERAKHSWSEIAREIAQRTGIVLSDETLRRWFRGRLRIEVTFVAENERKGGAGTGPGRGGSRPNPNEKPKDPQPAKTTPQPKKRVRPRVGAA